jgi:hypothetical protein
MFVASLPRSVTSARFQHAHGRSPVLTCLKRPASRLQFGSAQLSTRGQPNAERWHRPLARHKGSTMRHIRHMLTQALNEDATDRQRSVSGSGSEAVVRGGVGSTSSRLGELVNSPFDADIRSVALPALASIMLDAVMLLVDTGGATPVRSTLHRSTSATAKRLLPVALHCTSRPKHVLFDRLQPSSAGLAQPH